MTKKLFTATCFGLFTTIIIVLLFGIIMATLLKITSMSESSVALIPMIVSFVALFIGGCVSGLKMKERGLLVGAVTGLIYIFLVFLIQFLGFENGAGTQQMLLFLLYILTTTLGGIVGVNLFSRR